MSSPQISLSLRGVGDKTVEQGEPLRITVRLSAPRGRVDAIELAPATGAWSDAIAVELATAKNGEVVARGKLVGQPTTPHATLSAAKIAGGLWVISSASMKPILPGDYLVRARLTISGGRGWSGEVDTDGVPLRVVAKSEAAYRVAQLNINLAHEALLAGHIEEAAAIIDSVLQRMPDDVRLLTVRADIADRAGNPLAAMLCLNRARRANPTSGVGPPALEREALEARARASLQGDKMPSTAPPAWSWPPSAVLAIPESELIGFAKAEGRSSPVVPPVANASSAGPPSIQAPPAVVPPSIPATGPANPGPVAVGAPMAGEIVTFAARADSQIIADPAGQWAASATAGSQYGKTQYSPAKATGAPDINVAGNSPDAWCPESKDKGTDWLEVTFAKPMHATEVRVRQNDAAGAMVKVEAIEPDGTAHVWWDGVDPHKPPVVRDFAWFAVRVPKTSYLVARVKLTLNLASGPGWKQIDAVQLLAAP